MVVYFSRRHGVAQAEDLAQDTLTTLWAREDFLFETEDQFLRVCYGFASRILLQAYRQTRKHAGQPLDPAAPNHEAQAAGLMGMEVAVFVEEIGRAARSSLTERDWQLVQTLAEEDRAELSAGFDAGEANRFRVRLYRIRQKLTQLTGWGANDNL
jgi:DNA-directed RNA polymerase specialized sigma24 family protein